MIQLNRQVSESYFIGLLLAVAGGYLDVYTYISRGGVFANAQTGNIVLLGIHIAQHNFEKITTYTLPILAFMVGVMITEIVKLNFRYSTKIHWRHIVIALEILVLLAVSFVPEGICNDLVNASVSFVCSMQVESFRAFGGGKKYATTMCTGNLRTATENLFYSGVHRDRKVRNNSLQYYGIIAAFIFGAVISTKLTTGVGTKSVYTVCILLFVVFVLMFIQAEEEEKEEKEKHF